MSDEILCANRTYVQSMTTKLGMSSRGWLASCIACGHLKYGDTWRETYDWADEHASRGWGSRRWIPHSITFARDESGTLVDTTPEDAR